MRTIVIPPRQYAEFELECDEFRGKFKIKLEPFLQQREPNLWMDSFVIYNVPEGKEEVDLNEKNQEMGNTNEDSKTMNNETRKETKGYIFHIAFLILAM